MTAPSITIPFARARTKAIQSTATDADRMVSQGSFAAALVASGPDLPLLAALSTTGIYLALKDARLVGSWPPGELAALALLGGAFYFSVSSDLEASERG